MGKITYKKLLGVAMIFSLIVGVAACGSPKEKTSPAPTKIVRHKKKAKKTPPKKPAEKKAKVTEAFTQGKEGTFEALGETKRVIWDAYPDQLAYVKDAFYHWTVQDEYFQVNTGHYMVVDRLNSSGALMKRLQKGMPVKLDGKNYKVVEYKEFDGGGSSDKLLDEFRNYVIQFPKSAYFIQTCLDARTYGGQRLLVLDVAD